MKRKEYNEVTNKIVNVDQVLSRGHREPVFELTFKTSGYNRFEGHKVYIDFKCAQELLTKLNTSVRDVESKYRPHSFYERLQRSVDQILL
jgi:hypothetical protein